MFKKLIFLLILVSLSIPVFAQSADTAWVRRYNGQGNGWGEAYAIKLDGSGNVYVISKEQLAELNIDYATTENADCLPGDFNNDGKLSVSDIVFLFDFLFKCGPAPYCLPNEANGNCELDWADDYYLLNFLFLGGPAPVPFCSNPDSFSDPGYPDTLEIGTVSESCSSVVNVSVYISNDEAISVVIPLKIDTSRIELDTVITIGTRGEQTISGFVRYCGDSTSILLFNNLNPDTLLQPGSGIVAYLRCRIKAGSFSEFVAIDSSSIGPNRLRFFKENSFSIKPVFISGGINICRCGNVNGDSLLGVSDVVYLINYLFRGGPAPEPIECSDVNCDGKISVSDVVHLINYLFRGGSAPGC